MHSYPGVFAGATWPSFGTGRSPAHHRRFFRLQARAGDYGEVPFPATAIEGPYFWERLSQAGKRVAALDVPLAKLSPLDKGLNLVDWGSHDPWSPHPQASPPELIEELEAEFGFTGPDRCDLIGGTPDGTRELMDILARRLENKRAVSLHCLRQGRLGPLRYGVRRVSLRRPSRLAPARPETIRNMILSSWPSSANPLKEIYKALDSAVGALIAAAGEEAVTLIVNGEGIGPIYGVAGVLDEILWRLDTRPEAQPGASRGQVFRRLKSLWWSLPRPLREAAPLAMIKRALHAPLQRSALIPGRRDRPYYAMPNNASGGGDSDQSRGPREPWVHSARRRLSPALRLSKR